MGHSEPVAGPPCVREQHVTLTLQGRRWVSHLHLISDGCESACSWSTPRERGYKAVVKMWIPMKADSETQTDLESQTRAQQRVWHGSCA